MHSRVQKSSIATLLDWDPCWAATNASARQRYLVISIAIEFRLQSAIFRPRRWQPLHGCLQCSFLGPGSVKKFRRCPESLGLGLATSRLKLVIFSSNIGEFSVIVGSA